MNADVRYDTPARPEFAKAAAKQRADHTSSVIVTTLTLACSATAILDLILLATSH